MVEMYLFPVLVGTVLGALSGLGIGGGSLLMLWLTIVMNTDAELARIMNLMFFIPCALVTSLFRWRQGILDLRLAAMAILTGCAGSVLGNLWRRGMDLALLQKIFGILFILCGIRELLYRPRKER